MNSAPRACVVTVNYHGAQDTVECIASLKKSLVPVEVVVVDNSAASPELKKLLVEDTDVRIISAPENLGFGKGNNLGIVWALENTDCEFVLLLNNDATVEPASIQNLYKIMDEDDSVGLATGRIVTADREPRLWYGGGCIDWRRGGGSIPGFMGSAENDLALKSRAVEFASGCVMLVRRQVFERIGGFDPVFFMYEEDIDFSLRVSGCGYKLWYQPTAIFRHHIHGSQETRNEEFVERWSPSNPNLAFHTYHMVRNSIINMRKHITAKQLLDCLLFYPAFLAVKSFRICRSLGPRALKPVFRGLRDGLVVPLSDPAGIQAESSQARE